MFVGETITMPGVDVPWGTTNIYGVVEDQRALHSIRSTSDSSNNNNPAYEVDFSQRYSSEAEAFAAREKIYGNTSIYLAGKADESTKNLAGSMRSDEAYTYGCENAMKRYQYHEDSLNYTKAFWSDFQNDDTYKELMEKGGANSQEDVQKLLSAAERYKWQKSYKEYGVYEQDMFDFADKLSENTGVTVVSRGSHDEIRFTNNDSICYLDNYTFQFMATHQDNMELWENTVQGKYKNFSELTAAINDTGDEKLIADWKNSSILHTVTENNMSAFRHSADQYATASNYACLSLPVYGQDTNETAFLGENAPGKTAKDFWNEFRFNTGMTDELTGKFAMSGTIKDDGEIEWNTSRWLDPDKKKLTGADLIAAYQNKNQNQSSKAVAPTEKYNQQIDALKKKIKQVRSHLSALQKYSAGHEDEDTKKLIAADQKQISSYQKQIESIQMQLLEYQKQHLQD